MLKIKKGVIRAPVTREVARVEVPVMPAFGVPPGVPPKEPATDMTKRFMGSVEVRD